MRPQRIKIMKSLGWLVLGLVFGSGGTVLLQSWSSTSTDLPNTRNEGQPPPEAALTTELLLEGEPVLGSREAPLTIVEFSDFECPYCRLFHNQVLPSLKTEYIDTGLVRFVHKDLPLPFHRQAKPRCSRPLRWRTESLLGSLQRSFPSAELPRMQGRSQHRRDNKPRHNSPSGLHATGGNRSSHYN